MISKYNLFVDDVRVPTDVTWADVPIDQHYSVVRNYKEFVDLVTLRGVPKFVCYDYDLADCVNIIEMTGFDCAKWLVAYCSDRNIKHPSYVVHSKNPIGKQNIESYINSYNKML